MSHVASILMLCLLVGCAAIKRKDSVVGIYDARDPDFNFHGQLTIGDDSTYVLKWTRAAHIGNPDGSVSIRSGTERGRWRIESEEIVFEEGKDEKSGRSGKQLQLWGRYRPTSEGLMPFDRGEVSSWTYFRKEPNQPPEPTR